MESGVVPAPNMPIDEDRGEPIVRERVAPWGTENADEYVKRVERNLIISYIGGIF